MIISVKRIIITKLDRLNGFAISAKNILALNMSPLLCTFSDLFQTFPIYVIEFQNFKRIEKSCQQAFEYIREPLYVRMILRRYKKTEKYILQN